MKDINLRPHREEQEKRIEKKFNASIVIAFLLAISFIALEFITYSSQAKIYSERADFLNNKLENIEIFNKANENIKYERDNAIEKLNLSYSLYNGKLNTAIFFDELVTVFPSERGHLDSLIKNKQEITLKGYLDNEDTLHTFLKNLSKNKTFSAYTVKEITKINNEVYFTVIIHEKRN